MSVLEVPAPDRHPWPSLGAQVCDWMESHLAYGPGDLLGEPYVLDDEKRRLVWRLYEVFPRDHPHAGRRRFRRAAISLRKGSAKTEFGAGVVACELAPDGPVRTDGWRRVGKRGWEPVGAPVRDPYIPMLAYTAEQSDDLAYAALCAMLGYGPFSRDYDIGQDRVMRATGGSGRALALATSPDARDGARTTMELFDETHRLRLPRQLQAHRAMLANLPKRYLADPWALEITVAPVPGQNSVAERTMEYAEQVAHGVKADARLYFFHRQASAGHDLSTPEGVRAAVVEASGPLVGWSDVDGIVAQWQEPDADRAYLARTWLNMKVRALQQVFDLERWKALADPEHEVPDGALITLGFDGAKSTDWCALVATELSTGWQWPVGIWDSSQYPEDVLIALVDLAVAQTFDRYRVGRFYGDPPYWKEQLSAWQGKYGDQVVRRWETWRHRPMGFAVRNYGAAITGGSLHHSGDPVLTAHVGACHRMDLPERDDKGAYLFTVQKERPDSPFKIDGAVAAILSWEARSDALAAGLAEVTTWTLV